MWQVDEHEMEAIKAEQMTKNTRRNRRSQSNCRQFRVVFSSLTQQPRSPQSCIYVPKQLPHMKIIIIHIFTLVGLPSFSIYNTLHAHRSGSGSLYSLAFSLELYYYHYCHCYGRLCNVCCVCVMKMAKRTIHTSSRQYNLMHDGRTEPLESS